jgi:hypothetical protein
MSNLAVLRAAIAVSAVVFVSACGGGGGGSSGSSGNGGTPAANEDMNGSGDALGSYTALDDRSGTSTLQVVGIDDSNDVDRSITITFNHASGEAAGAAIAGVLNTARTTMTDPTNGDQLVATFSNPARTEYVRFVKSEIGDDLFGVVGQVTDPRDIPTTDDAEYNGVVLMTVNNDDGFYDLTGDATITARWGTNNNGRIDTLFDELSGQLPDTTQGSVSGSILIRNATLIGGNGSFSGTNLERTGTIFQSSNTPSTQFSGQLFGRNADEVGGVLVIEAANLDVNAVFAAE